MSRRMMTGVAAAAALLVAVTTEWADAKTRFRGGPKSQCDSFWLFETSYMRRVTNSRLDEFVRGDGPMGYSPRLDRMNLTLEIGGMGNIDERWAAGMTLAGEMRGDAGERIALKPRIRRWLGDSVALDVSVGALIGSASVTSWGIDPQYGYRTLKIIRPIDPGWLAEASLNIGDYAALTARYEIQRWEEIGTDQTLSIGAKCGSYPALFSTGVAAIVVAAAAISFAASGGISFSAS